MLRRPLVRSLTSVVVASVSLSASFASTAPLSTDGLFRAPARTAPVLSPDGTRLAYLLADDAGLLQLAGRAADGGVEVRLASKPRGFTRVSWREDSLALLAEYDATGAEDTQVLRVDLDGGGAQELSPWPGAQTTLLATSPRAPTQVLLTSNRRDAKWRDVWRVDTVTGQATLDTQNPGDVASWVVDLDLVVRGALATTKTGGSELRVRDGKKAPWRALVTVGVEEALAPIGFSFDGRWLYLRTSVLSDTQRLVQKHLRTGSERTLASSPTSDPLDVLFHAPRAALQAVAFDVDGRLAWTGFDSAAKADLDMLSALAPSSEVSVLSRDRADAQWVVRFEVAERAPRYALFSRATKALSPLFSERPWLDDVALRPMEPFRFVARDGTPLSGYLTRPEGTAPAPLVVLVHGGPWSRDRWGFQPEVQWLASRGAAVLQVNFRGSTGYGKRFVQKSHGQWGLAMNDDLADAVQWAARQPGIDVRRTAIMGRSYGGYAALAGVSFTPDTYRCAVAVAAPTDLVALLGSIPTSWEAARRVMHQRVGDPTTAAGKSALERSSPSRSVDAVKVPVLLAHGERDVRVRASDAAAYAQRLSAKGGVVKYLPFPDEGHTFTTDAARTALYNEVEAFLAQHLGTGKAR